MTIILYTLAVSFTLALILGLLLGIFEKVFYVHVDERIAKIRAVLPGVKFGSYRKSSGRSWSDDRKGT